MDYPEIDDRVIDKLDALGFTGLDANPRTNLFEYAGVYSPGYHVAFLVEVETRDPGVCLQHISPQEIAREVALAGPGFASFIGCMPAPPYSEGMEAIQALMLWNGGWHQNSAQWCRLSDWTTEELLAAIDETAATGVI